MFAVRAYSVLVTGYRRGVFTDAHLTATQPVLDAVYADVGVALIEFNAEDDRVHLLIE